MKKVLLAGVAALGIAAAGAASAADLPSRRVAPAPAVVAPIFTWTGFYVGVNAGYGWNTNDNKAFFDPVSGVALASGGSDGGFVGGGQIGYNYQIGQFVVGAEADLQYADMKAKNNFTAGIGPFGVGVQGNGIEWFGTVRARLGFAIDRALVYATGGFAYGGGSGNGGAFLYNGYYYGGGDDTRTGWTLGAGVEYAFTNNLTAKVEGLYVNLGRNGNNFLPGIYSHRKDTEFGVVRAGLNYKFSTF